MTVLKTCSWESAYTRLHSARAEITSYPSLCARESGWETVLLNCKVWKRKGPWKAPYIRWSVSSVPYPNNIYVPFHENTSGIRLVRNLWFRVKLGHLRAGNEAEQDFLTSHDEIKWITTECLLYCSLMNMNKWTRRTRITKKAFLNWKTSLQHHKPTVLCTSITQFKKKKHFISWVF